MERATRIAALVGASAAVRLRDIANGGADIVDPSHTQVKHLHQRSDPEELAVTLVRAGLAKKIGGRDNVASGAA